VNAAQKEAGRQPVPIGKHVAWLHNGVASNPASLRSHIRGCACVRTLSWRRQAQHLMEEPCNTLSSTTALLAIISYISDVLEFSPFTATIKSPASTT